MIDVIVDSAIWPDACDRIAQHCDANVFALFEFDFENHAAPFFRGSRVAREEGSELVAATQAGVEGEEQESYRRFGAFPSGRFFSEFEIYDVAHDRDLPPNPFRSAALAASGSRSRNVAKINRLGPWSDVAALHVAAYGADMSQHSRLQMDALVPLLERVVEAGRTVRALTRRYTALIETLDLLDFGAAILDPAGRVTLANATFRDMAQDGDAFILRSDRVIPVEEADRAPLSLAISACLGRNAEAGHHLCRLSRRSGKLPYVVRSMPIRLDESRGGAQVFSLLIVLDPDRDNLLSAEGIAALGILSQTETQICDLMVRGFAVPEIAERRDRSPETVKGQAKVILSKLNCGSRNDLVRLALSTRAPLRPAEK